MIEKYLEYLFLNKAEENLLEEHNFSMYSEKTKVLERLQQLNDAYQLDIGLTEDLRFMPGTYQKIKDKVIDLFAPHWKTKKGANKIHKLFAYETYQINNFSQKTRDLDSTLSLLRLQGMTKSSDDQKTIKDLVTNERCSRLYLI